MIITSFVLFAQDIDTFYESIKREYKDRGIFILAIIYICFLAIDIVLPIPSTIIMTEAANALGFLGASIISTLGLFLSNMIGFTACRFFSTKISFTASNQLHTFFKKHGATSIILTRSIPILPELISYMAGLSNMTIKKFSICSLIGALPIALYCSYIGSSLENRTYEMFMAIAFSAAMLIIALILKLFKNKDIVE